GRSSGKWCGRYVRQKPLRVLAAARRISGSFTSCSSWLSVNWNMGGDLRQYRFDTCRLREQSAARPCGNHRYAHFVGELLVSKFVRYSVERLLVHAALQLGLEERDVEHGEVLCCFDSVFVLCVA